MQASPDGSPCPHATITWLTTQTLTHATSHTLGATASVACNGAKVGQIVRATPRAALPTAGGAGGAITPYIYGYVPAADTVSLVASNPAGLGGDMVPAANLIFDVICLPVTP